ncbi:hypothetical protein BC828DRAFT_373667 [Blastocladiella britannica]|nr:hypothetical protein BC828DRAFT_373667 [Blastocladiella britannica]
MVMRALSSLLVLLVVVMATTAVASSPTEETATMGPVVLWRPTSLSSSASSSHEHLRSSYLDTTAASFVNPIVPMLRQSAVLDEATCAALTQKKTVALVAVEHRGVHAADLIKAGGDSPLVALLKTATTDSAGPSVEIAHLHAVNPMATVMAALHTVCPAALGTSGVVSKVMDASVPWNEVAQYLQDMAAQYPAAIVAYVGVPTVPEMAIASANNLVDANVAVPPVSKLPYIAQYQIFTPGLFMTLAVFIGLASILVVALSWLATVQAPAGLEGNKMRKPKSS